MKKILPAFAFFQEGQANSLIARNKLLLAFWLLTVVSACTYVPFEVSRSSEPTTLNLYSSKADHSPRHLPAPSVATGMFTPLKDGEEALAARLDLIDNATRTIDLKAFIIRTDHAGFLVADRLIRAADRGVKIRILLDDLFTRHTAGRITDLYLHPNVEIRIFNPFSRFSPSVVSLLLDYRRVTRRMHNRMMIGDGSVVIFGGRNIADEYFSDDTRSKFLDFDLLVAGNVTPSLVEVFEVFWQDTWAVPIGALRRTNDPAARLATARALFQERAQLAIAQKYPRISQSANRTAKRFHGRSRLVVDLPEKLRNSFGAGPHFVAESFFRSLLKARSEVLIITPYFVPEDYGARLLEGLAQRGVRVDIVTNSLASTNHTSVHGGYAKYRDQLLAAGINLYEIRANALDFSGGDQAGITLTLHTKIAAIDQREVFVSTLNFDPISVKGNTELGLFIESPEFARWIVVHVNPIRDGLTYSLRRVAKGQFVWEYKMQGRDDTLKSEPHAAAFKKFFSDFVQLFVVEEQL